MTLYLANGAKAVESNNVIETLAKFLDKNKIDLAKVGTGKHNVTYGKFEHIYTYAEPLKINGITGSNLTNGRK